MDAMVEYICVGSTPINRRTRDQTDSSIESDPGEKEYQTSVLDFIPSSLAPPMPIQRVSYRIVRRLFCRMHEHFCLSYQHVFLVSSQYIRIKQILLSLLNHPISLSPAPPNWTRIDRGCGP